MAEHIERFRIVLCNIITLYFLLDSMFKGIYHGKQAHKGKSVVVPMLEDSFDI